MILPFKQAVTSIAILSVSFSLANAATTKSYTVENDIEERLSSGSISTYSSDLELGGIDRRRKQIVGLRYTNLNIPDDMFIQEAYIQFNTDERSASSNVNIQLEISNTNAPFSSSRHNLSSRNYSNTTIAWTIPKIERTNINTPAYRTPNLVSLIDEAKANGWEHTDALVFKITGDQTASSTMDSKNSGSRVAPKLILVLDSTPAQDPISDPALITDVYVNEVSAKGTSNIDSDWIELYNDHDFPVLLNDDFYLSNKESSLDKFQLKNITIPAKSYVTFQADEKTAEGKLHTNFKLKSKGATVYLSKDIGGAVDIMDQLEYQSSQFNITYGKFPQTSDTVVKFKKGGSANQSNQNGIRVINLSASKKRGVYNSSFTVTLTPSEDATIKYTTDGSFPSQTHGREYSSPIDVNKNMVVKAIALADHASSDYVTNTYIISKSSDELKYPNLINNSHYMSGIKELPIVSISKDSSRFQGTEEITTFEYFDPAKQEDGIALEAGIKKYGAWSYHYRKNNLRIYFRDDYGYKKLNYDIFSDYKGTKYPATDTFKRLELKIGEDGVLNNDFMFGFSRFSDKLMHDAILKMGNLDVHTQFVHVYLNGKYYGVVTLRERFDHHFAESYIGGDDDDYERINNKDAYWHSGQLDHPEHQAQWNSVKADSNAKDYQAIKAKVDMESYIRVMLMYLSMDIEYEARGLMNTENSHIPLYFNLNDADGLLWSRNIWSNSHHWGGLYSGPAYIFGNFTQSRNLEFMTMVKDAIHKHFDKNNGVLSKQYFEDNIHMLVNKLDKSYKMDVARWGFRENLHSQWKNTEVPRLISELDNRFNTVLRKFRAKGLTHTLDEVDVNINNANHTVSFASANAGTKIYFTLDGTDPMGDDGAISGSAIEYTSATYDLDNQGTVIARAYKPNNWGPKTTVSY